MSKKWTKEIISKLTEQLNNDSLTRKEIADEYGLTWEQMRNVISKHHIPYSKTQNPGYTYKCKYCGAEFDNKLKLAGHSTTCKKNPKYLSNVRNLDNGRDKAKEFIGKDTHNILKCEYCGKEVHGIGCLVRHQMWCKKNPNRTKEDLERVEKFKSELEKARQRRIGSSAWNKGLKAINSESVHKGVEKIKQYYETHPGSFSNKKHSKKTRELLRLKMIQNIESCSGQMCPRYSKKGCVFIDKLNESKGWELQHAENGGEFSVCGYYIDGYDEKRNIAFEYDEPKHYESATLNILKARDIERQNLIIEKLGCKLYRYNEAIDLLYCVN